MSRPKPAAIDLVREAYLVSELPGLHYRLDGDQVTALLEVGPDFFAISNDSGGYSWAWGERTDLDAGMFGATDYFGEDGGMTVREAREAIAAWLARFGGR